MGPIYKLRASAGEGKPQRCFKTHWPRRDYMAKLPSSSKVIYIFREVDEVVISFFHHVLNLYSIYWLMPGDISWDVFFEKFISGDMEYGPYFEHIASWWKVRNDSNVLL